MNIRTFNMTAKNAAKWKKLGAVVETPASTLPPHLQAIIDRQNKAFGTVQVTLDMDKVDPFHPLHAMA